VSQRRTTEAVIQVPWEQRGDKRYYYRTVRIGRRAARRYVGAGPAAELAAAADELRRVQRALATGERAAEQARYRDAAAPLLEFCDATDVLARAALVAAGFHRHAGGAWRRCRGGKSTS
jgi:hypothetical protein